MQKVSTKNHVKSLGPFDWPASAKYSKHTRPYRALSIAFLPVLRFKPHLEREASSLSRGTKQRSELEGAPVAPRLWKRYVSCNNAPAPRELSARRDNDPYISNMTSTVFSTSLARSGGCRCANILDRARRNQPPPGSSTAFFCVGTFYCV